MGLPVGTHDDAAHLALATKPVGVQNTAYARAETMMFIAKHEWAGLKWGQIASLLKVESAKADTAILAPSHMTKRRWDALVTGVDTVNWHPRWPRRIKVATSRQNFHPRHGNSSSSTSMRQVRTAPDNRKFETTIRVRREDIEDDRLGVYTPQISMMAHSAAVHPDELVFEVLRRGFEADCYDGQPFFDADHPVLLNGTDAVSVSNFQGGTGTPWFLLVTFRQVKPLVFQTRLPYQMQALNKDSDSNVFFHDEYLYGIRARVNAGYGLWQFAYGSKQELTPENYAAARAAMQAMRYDGGRIMGVVPNLLVVPPAHEAAARALLTAEELPGGGTNIWRGSAELLVSPYLQE
ncbi:Mu-like prophage major head subunit gpT [Gemmobacter aquatilis]|uniref:Mu-like prophage major head subunit gpT n=2 Tax=Gemmobacter aquatilis TaxID=933059 RepID=A0A1H8H5M6_9RHOB|nr:Mu-like prophage major head subunit gpT [Gemmobacter aquatilis]